MSAVAYNFRINRHEMSAFVYNFVYIMALFIISWCKSVIITRAILDELQVISKDLIVLYTLFLYGLFEWNLEYHFILN